MLKKDSKALTDSGELEELSLDDMSQVAGGFGGEGGSGRGWFVGDDGSSSFGGEGGSGRGWNTKTGGSSF